MGRLQFMHVMILTMPGLAATLQPEFYASPMPWASAERGSLIGTLDGKEANKHSHACLCRSAQARAARTSRIQPGANAGVRLIARLTHGSTVASVAIGYL